VALGDSVDGSDFTLPTELSEPWTEAMLEFSLDARAGEDKPVNPLVNILN
jgi:hypothetical protein